MKIAITGGTGFVGRNAAHAFVEAGHEVVLVARGLDRSDLAIRSMPSTTFCAASLEDPGALAKAFCDATAVVHCAGINRERGQQTFQRVHIQGTRNVVAAAKKAGSEKIVLTSFLRARPHCGSGYHESKWAAEEIVRQSGLDFTVLKCGVIYGRGDHMLDHLSHAFYTFPVFAFVGFKDKPIRPNAVEDVTRIIKACALDRALSRQTVAVVGPDHLTLREAVRLVAGACSRHPLMFPMPIWFHYLLGFCLERVMRIPMVSTAQVRMLSEGVAEPLPRCDEVPTELAPHIRFTHEQIRRGLPEPGPFTWRDFAGCAPQPEPHYRHKRVFFEMP